MSEKNNTLSYSKSYADMISSSVSLSFKVPKKLSPRTGRPGRPVNIRKPYFTPEQLEMAVQVLMYSKNIYNWVASEARFMNISLDTPEGRKFFMENARKAALRAIQ